MAKSVKRGTTASVKTSRKKPGPKPRVARHGQTGGENAQARGFGVVLEAGREQLGLTAPDMLEKLLGVGHHLSPFPIGQYSPDERAKFNNIRNWETGKEDPDFGIEHRYGVLFGIWPGVLHLMGLFYSDLRDAKQGEGWKLERVRDTAQRLKRLLEHVEGLADRVEDLPLDGNATADDFGPRHRAFIKSEMFEQYGFGSENTGAPGWRPSDN